MDKSIGRLVWYPKVGRPRVIMEKISWMLLQKEKTRLSKEAQYQKSKGKLKLKYMFSEL